MLRRLVFVSAFVACLLVLTACGSHSAQRVAIAPPSSVPQMTSTTSTTTVPKPNLGDWLKGVKAQFELGRWLQGLEPRIPYSASLWMHVHECEQPDSWHAGGYFGNGLRAGGDGLGFSADAVRIAVGYARARGVDLPESGWAMSVDQQMQMAQAMLDATGSGPDCLRVVA